MRGKPTELPSYIKATGKIHIQPRLGANRRSDRKKGSRRDDDEDPNPERRRNGGRDGTGGAGDPGEGGAGSTRGGKGTVRVIGMTNDELRNVVVKHMAHLTGDTTELAKAKIHEDLQKDMNSTARGRLPVICAAECRAWEVVLELLEDKADPNSLDSTGHPILYWAIQSGSRDLEHREIEVYLTRLLQYGADPNFIDPYDGTTALFWVAHAH